MAVEHKLFDDQRLGRSGGIIEHHGLQNRDGAGEAVVANRSRGTENAQKNKTSGQVGAGVAGWERLRRRWRGWWRQGQRGLDGTEQKQPAKSHPATTPEGMAPGEAGQWLRPCHDRIGRGR